MMVGESCTPHMQAKVMGMLALGDAMGNIVGQCLTLFLSAETSNVQVRC